MKKGLTMTMIFEAESGNYGEGIGNITALKKMSRSDGNMYTYISRQAMRLLHRAADGGGQHSGIRRKRHGAVYALRQNRPIP